MEEGTILYLCTVAPLLYLLSDLLPSPSPPSQCKVYTECVTVRGGGWWCWNVLYCGPYSAGVLHSVSDQIQNLQNCFTTPNKMTSKDDIKGLVSLKFLGPWATPYDDKKAWSFINHSILSAGTPHPLSLMVICMHLTDRWHQNSELSQNYWAVSSI